jgi:hypothetical protein
MLCLIVAPLPLAKNQFAVKINNNNRKIAAAAGEVLFYDGGD